MRTGLGCGISGSAGSGLSVRWSCAATRSTTCCRAVGPPRWSARSSRWSPRRGCAAWPSRVIAATATRQGYAGWAVTDSLAAVRRELPRFGAQRVCHKVADRFFAALTDGRGVTAQRRGALERVGHADRRLALGHRSPGRGRGRMVAVLDGLGLTDPGHLHSRGVRGRRGGHPGRDRRPRPDSPPRAAWSSTPG